MVRVRPALAGDVRGTSQLRRVAWSVDRVQPCDQLLVAVAAFGQWPAPALRDLSLWAINRFGRMGWLALSERKQKWLPKAATVPDGAGHSWVQRTCGRYLSGHRGCFPAEPSTSERHLGDTSGSGGCREAFRGVADCFRTAGNDIGVHHYPCQSSITFQRMLIVKPGDCLLFIVGQSVWVIHIILIQRQRQRWFTDWFAVYLQRQSDCIISFVSSGAICR